MTAIPCTWCGQPATRRYPGRPTRASTKYAHFAVTTPDDCYLCPSCDAEAVAGRRLPDGVATFGVPVREEG